MKTIDKANLLGVVEVSADDVSKEPNLDILKKTEHPDTVIAAFCQSCGSYHELNFKEVEPIFMTLAQPFDFENKYLLFHSCSECKGEDKTVELKNF